MIPDKDNEASNGSVNESDISPEVQTTAANGLTTINDGVEGFGRAAMEKTVRRLTRTLSGPDKSKQI